MNVVLVYARLYADCLKKAFKGIRKNLWTLLLPMGLLFVSIMMGVLLAALLGYVAGIVIGLVSNALFSAYLYFLSETVQSGKATLKDFWRSLGSYFWAVMNVFFILWLVDLMLSYAIARNPHAGTIRLGVAFLEFVLLNAVPEVLYQRGTYGFASLMASVEFIQENWIEWLVPHLLVGAALYFIVPRVAVALFQDPDAGILILGVVPLAIIGGALFHVFMVFRGHLFAALISSSHRQRMYRFRAPT